MNAPADLTARKSPFVWERNGRHAFPADYQMKFRLDTPEGRRRAWRNNFFVDHQFLRGVWTALDPLDDKMWRANQPGLRALRRYKAMGIRSIVNLRGWRDDGTYLLEAEACRTLGLTLVDFPIRSRGAPHVHVVLGAERMFREIEYPALMHCKSGADRVGFMSVLYLHLQAGKPLREAMRQLHWTKLHFKSSATGVLDYFLERYLEETAEEPMRLTDWVQTRYYENELQAAYVPRPFMGAFVDKILKRE